MMGEWREDRKGGGVFLQVEDNSISYLQQLLLLSISSRHL